MGDGGWEMGDGQFGCRSLTREMGRRGDGEMGRESKPITSYLLPFTSYLLPLTFYLLPSPISHLRSPIYRRGTRF